MRLSFKRGERGFTLLEIIIVLAVLAILAAVIVPNITGFVGRGKERAWAADRDLLQAAVDAWRTDIGRRTGNPWPTIGGVIGTPSFGTVNDGRMGGTGDVNSFIDINALATTTGQYLKGADVVKSAAKDVTNIGSTNTNTVAGSYYWFIDSTGVVQSWKPGTDDTLGTTADVDAAETGFQTDIYP